MSRGNDKREMFIDHVDYARYLTLLERSAKRFAVEVLGYCLMPNHIHLLLRPNTQQLWRLMQHVNSAYCGWFNRRHSRVGHVLQGRYKAQIIEGGPNFLRVLRYVMLNPVAARKVTHPGDWPWSSFRSTAGIHVQGELLALADVWHAFDATDRTNAQRAFRRFVAGDLLEEHFRDDLLIGSDGFIRGFAPMLAPHRKNRELVHAERFADRPTLPELIPDVSRGPAMHRAVHLAFERHAFTLRQIAEHVGVSPSAVWIWARLAAREA